MKKKTLIVMLAVLLSLSSSALAQASNDSESSSEIVTPFYDYITVIGSDLLIENLGRSFSSGFVFYSGNYNSTMTIKLQRYNGTGWTDVKSWSQSFTGGGHHSMEEEYYVLSGYTYRVMTIVTVKDGSTVLETASSTSSPVEY